MTHCKPDDLPLQRLYHLEHGRANEIYLTQPMGGGVVRDLTWREAVDEARRMAAHLQSRGWEPGSRIAILSKNSAWWLLADYAIWMAGHISVPIYPTLTAESVRQILDHSGAKACFVGKLDAWETMKPGIPASVYCIATPLAPRTDYAQWDEIIRSTPPLAGSPVRAAEDLATIIYTSGTTGMPKGVMHSFGSIGMAAKIATEAFGTRADDRVISHLPLAHVGERFAIEAASLQAGFRIFFAESLETFAQDLQRARPTMFGTVPRLWTKFQQAVFSKKPKPELDRLFRLPIIGRLVKKKILKALGLDQVRFAFSGAAPLPPEMLAWYRDLGLSLMELYGMTENFAISHCTRPGRVRIGYVGEPYDGVQVKLSQIGEVLIKSPCNMLGYYKEPGLTRDAFTEDGYLRTGDVGEIDEMNRLKITGRAKEQFKTSKGKYVAPAPIENKLGAHPKIEACCVTGVSFPQPFAIVMLPLGEYERCREPAARGELTRSLQAHLEAVNPQLDPHEQLEFLAVVPEQWTVDNGFITPTFKVKRAVIEQHYGRYFKDWELQKQPILFL